VVEPEISIGSECAATRVTSLSHDRRPKLLNMAPSIPRHEVVGVPALVAKLREWLYNGGIDEVPLPVEDPDCLLADLSSLCHQLGVEAEGPHFIDYPGSVLPPANETEGERRANGQFLPKRHDPGEQNFLPTPKHHASPKKRPSGGPGGPSARPLAAKKQKPLSSVRARLGKKLGLSRR